MANEKLRNFKQKKKHAQRDEYIMKLAASLKKTSGVLLKLK
jgi:hypothetical protein